MNSIKKLIHIVILFLLIFLFSCNKQSLFEAMNSYPATVVPNNIEIENTFTEAVTSLTVHNGRLYAGTKNSSSGAEVYIYQSNQMIKVLDPTQGIFPGEGWNGGFLYVSAMYSYDNKLYVGVYNSSGARLYRTVNDSVTPHTWEKVYQYPSGSHVAVGALIRFDTPSTYLYVGFSSYFGGSKLKIFRSATGNNGSFAEIDTNNTWANSSVLIDGFAVFNDGGVPRLFLSTEKDPSNPGGGCELWFFDGSGNWQARVNNDNSPAYALGVLGSGFSPVVGGSNDDNIGVPSLLVYSGYLYMGVKNVTTGGGAGNPNTGAKIFRTNDTSDGSAYEEVVNDGFGNIQNISIDSIVAYQGYIYALTRNTYTGTELWRSPSGAAGTWSKRNQNGFGDANNTSGRAAIVHNGIFYIGLERAVGTDGATIIQYGAAP